MPTPLKTIFNALTRRPVLALLDQCVASGTRFLAFLLIGRFAGPTELGVYTIIVAMVIGTNLIQEALIARPYQVFLQRMSTRRQRSFSGSTLTQFIGLAALFAVLSIVGGVAFGLWKGWDSNFTLLAFALAIQLPGTLCWDFSRRYAFAKLNMGGAIVIDTGLAIVQIGSLLVIHGVTSRLTALHAVLAVGTSSLVVGLAALGYWSIEFSLSRKRLWLDAVKNFRFGSWLLIGQFIGFVQGYSIPYLLAATVGMEATGIFMACQQVVLLSNPFLLGISNWLGPQLASTHHLGGLLGLARLTRLSYLTLGGLMSAFWLVLVFYGELAIGLLFGDKYMGYGNMLAFLGATMVGFALSIAGTAALAAMNRTRIIMVGTFCGTIMGFATFFPFVYIWGLSGAAAALGLGSLTSGMVHVVGFEWCFKRENHNWIAEG